MSNAELEQSKTGLSARHMKLAWRAPQLTLHTPERMAGTLAHISVDGQLVDAMAPDNQPTNQLSQTGSMGQ